MLETQAFTYYPCSIKTHLGVAEDGYETCLQRAIRAASAFLRFDQGYTLLSFLRTAILIEYLSDTYFVRLG